MSDFDYTKAFLEGGEWAKHVALLLNQAGVSCHAPAVQIARNNAERRNMTLNEKDILLDDFDFCLEVKSTKGDHTTDIKEFPWRSLFVDTVSGYDAKIEKPFAYIIVSKVTGDPVCILTETYPKWSIKTTRDENQHITESFYSASASLLISFDELVGILLDLKLEGRRTA